MVERASVKSGDLMVRKWSRTKACSKIFEDLRTADLIGLSSARSEASNQRPAHLLVPYLCHPISAVGFHYIYHYLHVLRRHYLPFPFIFLGALYHATRFLQL